MYVNVKILQSNGLLFSDIVFLATINQKETEFLVDNLSEHDYNRYKELSLIEHIKQKSKKEHLYTSLRLSQRGKELLSEIEEAEVEEQDIKILNWLCDHYTKIGKTIGNKKRTARHIRDFRIKSNIEKNNLIKVCLDFLQDEENMEYNNVLEYAFYKPLTAFQTRFNLEDSRLYKHFLKHRERIESTFEQY
jgi:hypothetical protein